MKFNEDSRVKIPAIFHFTRLGYLYQSKKNIKINPKNNILVDIFKESIKKINNKDYTDVELEELIKEIEKITDNDKDKGKAFFERLTSFTGVRLLDLENPLNNDFRIVTELSFFSGREEFRPDITLVINGLPLCFYEVKKPNNRGYTNKKGITKHGIQAEFARMSDRLAQKEFKHFFNQLQILAFSNNQAYDDGTQVPLQGSFYTTPNDVNTSYNHFREEQEIAVNDYINDALINSILSDNNIMSIKNDAEFIDNLKPTTPANSFATSVFSKERIIYLIRYGIVYVDSQMSGLNKHIIRYPQYFALQKLIEKLDANMHRGILWHTQGSGKTAYTYFATSVLRDYFQKKKIIPKFYFITDRLDLLIQAATEFGDRGMTIAQINNKADFAKNIKLKTIIDASQQRGKYKETMNVVNIHKFSEESTVELNAGKGVQRVYFIDEVHRGYKLQGTFLANLLGADPDGIFIGLTGTPILKKKSKSTDIFQGYIHKYYYNKSIADGYTLKIKKENIATTFKNDIKVLMGIPDNKDIPAAAWEKVTSTEEFVLQLCKYIQEDFDNFITVQKDKSLGFMVVTSNSEQARLIQNWFMNNSSLKTALVLYDEENNEGNQKEFRGKKDKATGKTESKLNGVIVYNMLLTGFDAPRLKRLYLLRKIREHSLLQTLARVNRPYKNMRYGYIVDFVDITEEYEETNRRYLEELKNDIEDDETDINDMFVDVEKVKATIKVLENKLFAYMGNIETNLEAFRMQIENLEEGKLRTIRGEIEEYRACYNELKMSHEDVSRIPIERLNMAYYELSNRINLIVANRTLSEDDNADDIDYTQLVVEFLRIGEIDLDFTTENDILELINKISNAFSANLDKEDNQFINLRNDYKNIIKEFKLNSNTTEKIKIIIVKLTNLLKKILILNDTNNNLVNKYKGDNTCMRIHKRLKENYNESLNDIEINFIMLEIIGHIDKLMLLGYPTQNVVLRELLKPVRGVFKKNGHTLSKRQVEDIIYLFIDDKFTQD
jgi:type I restriction enzyme, R subunit